MNINDIFLAIVAVVALVDVLFVKCFFPRILSKNPKITPEKITLLQNVCYSSAALILVIAFVIHHLHIIA